MSSQMGCPEGASAECRATCRGFADHLRRRGESRNRRRRRAMRTRGNRFSAASWTEISPCTNRTPIVGRGRRPRRLRPSASRRRARGCTKRRAPGQRHHHRRHSLVACRDSEDAAACRRRSNQPPEDGRRIVAERRAVEHRRRSLRSAVTSIAARRREVARAARNTWAAASTSRPISQCRCDSRGQSASRRARGRRRASEGSETPSRQARRASHAGVLAPPEEVARRLASQQFRSQRRCALVDRQRSRVEESVRPNQTGLLRQLHESLKGRLGFLRHGDGSLTSLWARHCRRRELHAFGGDVSIRRGGQVLQIAAAAGQLPRAKPKLRSSATGRSQSRRRS